MSDAWYQIWCRHGWQAVEKRKNAWGQERRRSKKKNQGQIKLHFEPWFSNYILWSFNIDSVDVQSFIDFEFFFCWFSNYIVLIFPSPGFLRQVLISTYGSDKLTGLFAGKPNEQEQDRRFRHDFCHDFLKAHDDVQVEGSLHKRSFADSIHCLLARSVVPTASPRLCAVMVHVILCSWQVTSATK